MLALIMKFTIWIYGWIQKLSPADILLRRLQMRDGLRWGIPAMLIGVAYFVAAFLMDVLVRAGWSSALYLLFAIFIYNAGRFILFGPWSLILLTRVRHIEARTRKMMTAAPR